VTYLEFLKEFDCRMIVYSVGAKRHDWTPRKDNEFDICGFGTKTGLLNGLNKNIPLNLNLRIKTINTKLIEIFSNNKIKDYIDVQPIRTKSINTQSLQNIYGFYITTKKENKMKILISSVHVAVNSGYGMISKQLLEMLPKIPNVELKMIAYYGAKYKTEYNGIEILPNWGSGYIGEESILAECKTWNPDLVLFTYDIFILEPSFFKKIKATGAKIASLLMVDSSPFGMCNIPTLHEIDYPICVTEWALNQIPTEVSKRATYVPLGLDSAYRIIDRNIARKRFNELMQGNVLNDDTELTTIVSANCGDDRSRKGFYPMILGWKKYLEKTNCKNKYLNIHSDVRGLAQGGSDLKTMMLMLKYTAEQASTVIFPLQMKYLCNEFSVEDMANIYSASNVYLSAAQSEGFGKPITESIACGCYPLVTNFGASRELIYKTQNVPEAHLLNGSSIYVGNNSVRCHVTEDEVAESLTAIYEAKLPYYFDNIEPSKRCMNEYGELTQINLWTEFLTKVEAK